MSNVSVGSVDAAFVTKATDVLNAYNRRGNMYDAKLEFHKLLNDLQTPAVRDRLKRARMGVDQTIEAFEKEHLRSYVVFKLAMSMSPLAFRSVLSGTIAWQASQTAGQNWYSAIGPGVYAVGVAVDGRGGKFLNAQEILLLAQGCEQYSAGYDALKIAPGQRTLAQRLDAGYLHRVDNAISSYAALPNGGRSILNDQEQQRVLIFAERLRERANVIMSVDPTGNEIQKQSPLYIGCSDKLENRTRDYMAPANLSNINKLLVLTLNVLKLINLPSRLHVRTVIRIWEQHQLPYAERLVTTLAESLVAQNGFNATEAGGRVVCLVSKMEFMSAKAHVFSVKPFFSQHLDGVNSELEKRENFLKHLSELDQSLDRLRQEIDEAEQQLDNFLALKPMTWKAALSLLEKKKQKLRQQFDMLLDLKIRLRSVARLQEAMLPQGASAAFRLESADSQQPSSLAQGTHPQWPIALSSSPAGSATRQTLETSSIPDTDEVDVD